MKTTVKNQKGFTLVEMMIVLLIISILLLIAVPNMTKNSSVAQSKGCEATIELLQTQVGAYEVEKGAKPATLQVLLDEDYVDRIQCPDGKELTLTNGKVVVKPE
ncbi:competence type IV pilus major pilin ComGC [Bacillus alkalicellulosilyticus]|uniref:competence type IV pilus major pilin ComGC n=1 Tax=Alkalihalobacterium alkalicellulosilyticum TaxID=1912214 RepID=UPI00099658CD|nr:competence type IV pilus major pilin ComGC [Bacillus alkalicellulosilyticus]